MNLDRSLIFSYLEEDNIQRAYFRVRPLLSLDGDVQQEAAQLWPNEGGLRIVPDRNEQHTFKVRMRKLGSYCVIDLRDQPAEAGKIRTNKNFKPDRGEVNQYILYSDTVHELPEHTFYQLVEGQSANYQELAKDIITPLFYIRQNDTLYGPIHKDTPTQPETAKEAAGTLFELHCPDQITRLILCMDDAKPVNKPIPAQAVESKPIPENQNSGAEELPAAQKAPKPSNSESSAAVSEQLPLGESLVILDASKNHEETLQQLNKPLSEGANLLRQKQPEPVSPSIPLRKSEPLSGTPLIRTPLHVAAQQTKNHIQEVVSNQWSIGTYEPPAQNLPAGTALRAVENPVETACTFLREAWNAANSHDQLTDFMLSLDGMRSKLEVKLCNGENVTLMQRVLRQRLQDLEAERLTALCELDRARRDVDAYKQELVNALSARISKETHQLETNKKRAEDQAASLKQEINALILQRDALLAKVNELQSAVLPEAIAKLAADAQMTAPVSGIPLRISPVSGENTNKEELIVRLKNVFAAAGLSLDDNAAIAMIVLLAVSPRIGIACPTPAAITTLVRNLIHSLGWSQSYAHQFCAEQHPLVGMRPVDSTPAILATSLPNYAPIADVTKLIIHRGTANLICNAAYDVNQWPILMLPALPFIPEADPADAQPVSASSLAMVAEHSSVSNAELDAVLSPVLNAVTPLSGSARKEMYRFVSVCANLMEGGLPVAADWGILLWIVPALERGSKQHAAVKAMLDEYPLSLEKL